LQSCGSRDGNQLDIERKILGEFENLQTGQIADRVIDFNEIVFLTAEVESLFSELGRLQNAFSNRA
jgi:hypothetical protein